MGHGFGPLAQQLDVDQIGAIGKTQNREAINKAIETAAAAGGGTVEFPAGTWVTGSVRLRSNLTLIRSERLARRRIGKQSTKPLKLQRRQAAGRSSSRPAHGSRVRSACAAT